MDECLGSGILLYTLNFATARPIAFTSVSTQTHLRNTTVRQLLLSSSRRAAQSASSLFFTVPTRHATAGSRSVYRCPTWGTARPDMNAICCPQPRPRTVGLATALIQSRLNYSNSVLYGTSTSNLHKLQMVQNALARTITRSLRSVPTSQLLSNHHWLPIHKRISFKVATLRYKASPLNNLLTFIISYLTINPVVLSVLLVILSSTFPGLKPILDTVLSPLLLPKSGTIYLPPL